MKSVLVYVRLQRKFEKVSGRPTTLHDVVRAVGHVLDCVLERLACFGARGSDWRGQLGGRLCDVGRLVGEETLLTLGWLIVVGVSGQHDERGVG